MILKAACVCMNYLYNISTSICSNKGCVATCIQMELETKCTKKKIGRKAYELNVFNL